MRDMLRFQQEFTEKIVMDKYGKRIEAMSNEERQEFMKDLVLHIVDECLEFLRELNWKMHRKSDKPFNREAALKELVDVSKFHMNFLVIMGVNYNEFGNAWIAKHDEVLKRYMNEHNVGPDEFPLFKEYVENGG